MSCGEGDVADRAPTVVPEPTPAGESTVMMPPPTAVPEVASAPATAREAIPQSGIIVGPQRSVPLRFSGTMTYEEMIVNTDTIVRASFVSVEPGAEQKVDESNVYYPAMVFTFTVHEYLRGSGGNTIRGIVTNHYVAEDTEGSARKLATEDIAEVTPRNGRPWTPTRSTMAAISNSGGASPLRQDTKHGSCAACTATIRYVRLHGGARYK